MSGDPMAHEWVRLLEVATNYMVAAEAMIEGLQGKLGVDHLDPEAREKAAVEVRQRVEAYTTAREEFAKYGREMQAAMHDD